MLDEVVRLCERAGESVMEVYSKPFTVEHKADRSPVTAADQAAHRILCDGLNALGCGPVLSEESAPAPYSERRSWKEFWLVDPLDGTKEFIQKNGDFTVNVARIRAGRSVMGVVHAPVRALTYSAEEGRGAMKTGPGGKQRLAVDRSPQGPVKIVASRLHRGEALERFLSAFGPHEEVGVGSSLKFCLVAEGAAHIYPRFAPTMEWDTAAADCVLKEAGGYTHDLNGKELRYNKESLVNPWFVAASIRVDLKGVEHAE